MKVAIVGAGASGLVSIKTCLEEGLEPVCFEQEDTIGGLWNYTEEERHSSVYRSAVINTSKEMSCFSDFPIPKEFPPFMPHTGVMEYFHLYAKHFDLYRYIRLNTKVERIARTTDHSGVGKWQVCVKTQEEKPEASSETFDAVMICNGHLWNPNVPSFDGLEGYSGLKMHSHAYKSHSGFEGKVVLVVGLGNSAADIAAELSRHASQVYLSTRRGAWVISRLANRGLPWDHYLETRFNESLPIWLREWLEVRRLEQRFDHENYGLRPEHGIFNAPSVISDDLPFCITKGTLKIKPNLSHFTKTGAAFTDGTEISKLDAVIFATGYNITFEFLKDTDYIVPVKDNHVSLYKSVFPPHLPDPTLAVLGLIQSSGAFYPAVEMQARWVVRVFKGMARLPSKDAMLKDISEKKRQLRETFYSSKRLTIQVSSIAYKDELADLIGCKPRLWRLLFRDPVLALRCYFGPCSPPQYRLMGPGAWPGAKKAIEDTYYNTVYPTRVIRKRNQREKGEGLLPTMCKFAAVFLAAETLNTLIQDLK